MATKNIYIKDSNMALVEGIEKNLPEGESLSSLFIDCLKDKQKSLAETVQDVSRIKVRVGDPPITKVFEGRWLFGSETEGIAAENDDDGVFDRSSYSAAQTKQGRIVIVQHGGYDVDRVEMEIYDTFKDFKDATMDIGYPVYRTNIIAAVAEALDVPFEVELDI